jgi:adenylate cyclase
LGFSLVQAAIFGSLLGVMVYYRLPLGYREDGDEPMWHQRMRAGLERLELPFFDWRARSLGERSDRSEEVVVVGVNEETLNQARQAESPVFGLQPWPRELVAALTAQMLDEGAAVVLLDWQMPDQSPVGCRPSTRAAALEAADDAAFRKTLDRFPSRTVLAFGWTQRRGAPVVTGLYPYLLKVARGRGNALESEVRRVLALRRPAFVVPEGEEEEVWAGITSADDGAFLATTLELKGPPEIREYAARERHRQVTSLSLLTKLAEVRVDGLDISKVLRVRRLEPPFPVHLGQASHFGSVELRGDVDGIVRTVPLLVAYEASEGRTQLFPSATLVAAMQLARSRELSYRDGLLHIGGKYRVPMEPSGLALLRWDTAEPGGDGRGSLRRLLSAWRVIVNHLDAVAHRPPHYDNDLDGRAVVFSQIAGSGAVHRRTPIGRNIPQGAILAQSLANILKSQGLRRVEPRVDLAATFAMAFLGAFLALTFSGKFRSSLGALLYFSNLLVAGGVYLFVAHSVFMERGVWLAVAAPLISMTAAFFATTGYVFRTEAQLRDFIYGALGRYISPELARRVHRDLSLMRPERRRVTVCAYDLQGFTYRTRGLPPEALAELLGEYLSSIGEIVRRTGGLMERYGGDQVLAWWGAPLPDAHHAHNACVAALDIQKAVEARSASWRQRFGFEVRLRTAVETGEAMVGDLGSSLDSRYAIVGGVVSLATSLTKSNATYGTKILVSEATAALAGDLFTFREADRLILRSDDQPTVIFELVGKTSDLEEPDRQRMAEFARALDAYHARHFEEAQGLFEKFGKDYEDALAALYAVRAQHYLQRPPPPEWDRVFERRAFPGV